MSIGSRIKECRESIGMTQEELADIMGVSKGTIGNYETDVSYPRFENMSKLFDALKTDANYIFQDVLPPPLEKERPLPLVFKKRSDLAELLAKLTETELSEAKIFLKYLIYKRDHESEV